MISVRMVLFAERIIVDHSRNNASAIEIMDDVKVRKFPLVIPKICILAMFEREGTDSDQHKVQMRISLDSTDVIVDEQEITFRGTRLSRFVAEVNQCVIPKPGKLSVVFLSGTHNLGGYWVRIEPPDAPPTVEVRAKTEAAPSTSQG